MKFPFRRATAAFACIASLLSAVALGQDSVFPSKEEKRAARLLDAAHVSDKTRGFLKNKMQHHSEDMRELVMSVVLLDYDRTRSLAWSIANQPRLDRDAAKAEGAEVDDSFFKLQDELRTRARTLAEASADHDPNSSTMALSAVMNTCTTCHAMFRTPPKQAAQVR